MIQVLPISTNIVHQTWPKIEPFLAKVEPYSKASFSLEQMRTEIFTGRWLVYVAVENMEVLGALAMQYQNRMNARVAFIFAIGGKGIAQTDSIEQLKELFKKNGATELEGSMRPSAYRLWKKFGLKAKYQVAGMKL